MKQKFNLEGTSCKSCEVVIERALRKQKGITEVDANHKKHTLTIETENASVSLGEINAIISEHGYRATESGNGNAHMQKQSINWGNLGGALILILSLYVIFSRLGILSFSPTAGNPTSLIGVLVIGVIASLSSCTAVVGGLIAAVSSSVAKGRAAISQKDKIMPHILFNLGRIVGFGILGSIIGLAGSSLQLSPTLNGIFVVFVAILMLVIGINLMDIFQTPLVSMPKWLAHRIHDMTESKNPLSIAGLGALTFFLPCGFTQSMQLYAISLQDPLYAGIVMAVFAIGTTPVLLGIGGATSLAKGQTLQTITKIAGAIVLVLGFSNMIAGLALVGVNPETMFARAPQAPQGVVQEGRQQVTMRVSSAGRYEPSVITVEEGVPVDWNITGDSFLGCADTLILPAFGVSARIKPGKNLVQFTPNKAGKFSFNCSMGMVRGTLIVNPK